MSQPTHQDFLKRYCEVARTQPDQAGLVLLHLTLLVGSLPDILRDHLAVEAFNRMDETGICNDFDLSFAYLAMGTPEGEKPPTINDI